MSDSNFRSLKVEDNVCKRLYVSRPLVCRLRLADGDDTTMSGEDMRRAAHQLRCKDTEFLRHLHVLAQVFLVASPPCPSPWEKGTGVRQSIQLLIKLTIFRPRESFLSGKGLSCSDFCENKRVSISSRQSRNCKILPLRHAETALFSQCFPAFSLPSQAFDRKKSAR